MFRSRRYYSFVLFLWLFQILRSIFYEISSSKDKIFHHFPRARIIVTDLSIDSLTRSIVVFHRRSSSVLIILRMPQQLHLPFNFVWSFPRKETYSNIVLAERGKDERSEKRLIPYSPNESVVHFSITMKFTQCRWSFPMDRERNVLNTIERSIHSTYVRVYT